MTRVAAMLQLSDRLIRDGVLRGDSSFLVRAAALRHEAFREFKLGDWATALRAAAPHVARGAAVGAGAAIPAALAGHALISDARRQSHDVLRDARNQTLLTALGVGGIAAANNGMNRALTPHNFELSGTETGPEGMLREYTRRAKFSSVRDIAEAVFLDDLLEEAVSQNKVAGIDLFVHRVKSASLLEYVP
jgi:hypothetical protein